MDENEIYKLLGYIKISPYRTETLKAVTDEFKMPSEIAREINVKTSQVSAALSDLKKKELVVCVNEEVRKGRLYTSTDLGKEVIKKL